MPTLLLSFKRISDSEILIHGMLAPNVERAEKMMEEHAGICPKFGPAHRAGETIEHDVDVDDIPEFEEQAIGEWVDEVFCMESEGDGDEEEDDEEEVEEGEEEGKKHGG